MEMTPFQPIKSRLEKSALNEAKVKQISTYVTNRQNEDGGYTFAQWTESSAQDTYFALQILQMLGVIPEHREETIRFLQGLQKTDGTYDSMNVAYYCVGGLSNLGAKTRYGATDFVNSLRRQHGGFGILEVDAETSSEFETTYLALSVLETLVEPKPDTVNRFVLGRMNPDGTFGGGSGYSTLASVHFAIASLKLMDYDVRSLNRTLEWLRTPPKAIRATAIRDCFLAERRIRLSSSFDGILSFLSVGVSSTPLILSL